RGRLPERRGAGEQGDEVVDQRRHPAGHGHRYASAANFMPFWLPFSSSAARFGIANPHPGSVTVSSPPMEGRCDGPCWVSQRFLMMIRPALANAAGITVPHPATYTTVTVGSHWKNGP